MNKGQAPGAAIRVLLVDDHQTMLWGLSRLIESAAPLLQLVGTAQEATAALTLLEGGEVDVVLLDLDLNGVDGASLVPEIHKRCEAKVLILTGSREMSDHERAVVKGARGVVRKDEPAEVILRAIERVHAGEIWANRQLMGRVLSSLAGPASVDQSDPEEAKIASLTPREREIAAAVVRHGGAKGAVIADALSISENTLRNHLSVIYDKLGLRNRLDLFAYASKHRIEG
ncbi:MAG: response regulator transcription factor [Rhodocyclaceae bacterium]|nr:response regulator transcription factor [Rhodocyclaceae bacterium]